MLFRSLRELPNEFTREDLRKVMEEKGLGERTIYTYTLRMVARELVMDCGDHYKKLDIDDP